MKRDFLRDLGGRGRCDRADYGSKRQGYRDAKRGSMISNSRLRRKTRKFPALKSKLLKETPILRHCELHPLITNRSKRSSPSCRRSIPPTTADLQQKLKDQQTEFETSKATEAFFDGVEFSSQLAREAAISQFRSKAFKLENGTFQGGKEWLEELRKNSPDAFKPAEPDPADPSLRQPIFTKNINNPAPAPSSGGNPFVGGWNFQQVRNFDKSKE